MISAIINSIDTSPLPTWLAILILVIVFIAVSAVTGYLTFRYRMNSFKEEQDKNDDKSAE